MRGFPTRNPYAVKPVLTPCYGFKVEDVQHRRQLWCEKCRRWSDRDIVAVMNQSLKGWVRFAHSKGEAVEAVKRNQTMPVILSRCLEGMSSAATGDAPEPNMECETRALQGVSDCKTL